jgi:hypothetical protein
MRRNRLANGILERAVFGLEPFRGAGFQRFDKVGDSDLSREAQEDVNVVFDAVDGERGSVERFEHGDQIGMEFVAEVFVFEEGLAMFCAEDDVDQNVGEGLGHGGPHHRLPLCDIIIRVIRTLARRIERLARHKRAPLGLQN